VQVRGRIRLCGGRSSAEGTLSVLRYSTQWIGLIMFVPPKPSRTSLNPALNAAQHQDHGQEPAGRKMGWGPWWEIKD
jgi:hypothetical protein